MNGKPPLSVTERPRVSFGSHPAPSTELQSQVFIDTPSLKFTAYCDLDSYTKSESEAALTDALPASEADPSTLSDVAEPAKTSVLDCCEVLPHVR